MKANCNTFPPNCDLSQFGLKPEDIKAIIPLRQKPQHSLYRIVSQRQSAILKCFDDPANAVECQVYRLLAQYGVPTLPVHAIIDQGILLEDLATSGQWRLATETDGNRAEVGTAVANWYRTLHQAGFRAKQDRPLQDWDICPWISGLDADILNLAGEKLEIKNNSVWALVKEQIESLKSVFLALPLTFNYNDFALENVALSRTKRPLQAIVFDYDQFSLGPVFSDWRNVTYGLKEPAREAFMAAYGPVDLSAKILDEPLSIIYGLVVASQRPHIPAWAKPLLASVQNGRLEQMMRLALAQG